MTMHRLIDGVPYVLTRLDDPAVGPGWKVTRASDRTDRFARSYFVRLAPNGRPYRCSCPACHHGGGDGVTEGFRACKHIKAIDTLVRVQVSDALRTELDPNPSPV